MSHGHAVDLNSIDPERAQAVAQTMSALSAPSRVLILSRLAAGACSVNDLAEAVEMSQPAVSQQLRVLRYLGIVVGEREGRRVVYELHDDHVRALLAEAISHDEHVRAAAEPARADVGAGSGGSIRAAGRSTGARVPA